MLVGLFGSRLRAKVVGWLFTHADQRYFVRQLEALLREDATNLSRELARLERLGILTSQLEGRQKYYQANPDCPIFAELRSLVVKTAGVADVLRAALSPLADRIRVAFLYGSMARGRERAGSDVDVIVVGEVSFAEVVSALMGIQETLGREVNPTVYPPTEFRAKLAAGHHFLKAVLGEPKIFLIGDERELGKLVEERLAKDTPDQPAGNRRSARRGRS